MKKTLNYTTLLLITIYRKNFEKGLEWFYLVAKPVQGLQIQHIDYMSNTATKYNLLNRTKGKKITKYPVSFKYVRMAYWASLINQIT